MIFRFANSPIMNEMEHLFYKCKSHLYFIFHELSFYTLLFYLLIFRNSLYMKEILLPPSKQSLIDTSNHLL